MKRTLLYAAAVLTAIALTAAVAAAGELVLQPGSTLELRGTSTMHDYEAKASKLDVAFTVDSVLWPADANGAEAIERLIHANGVTGMTVVVPVTGLRSGKNGLDKNMYKALLAEKHPEIRYRMASYQVAEGAGTGEITIQSKGTLTVAGVDREIAMAVKAVRVGEHMKLHGEVPLLMSDFKIKPPTMMMGALRTADEVTIRFDLLVAAKSDAVSRAE
jgi:polyisoprenoid-binding protein YceI